MRIVTWNMNHCRRSDAKRRRAWEYLRDGLRADLVLAQEAVPPPEVPAVYLAISDTDPAYRWGSAVVALRPGLVLQGRARVPLADCHFKVPKRGEVPDSHPGASAVADVKTADGRHLFTAISLYGQWEMTPGGKTMYACTRVHRMLSDLTGILARSRRHPVVLAGDLNLTTQGANIRETKTDADAAAVVFARLRAWHMTDCIASTRADRPGVPNCTCLDRACSHARTYRHNNRVDSSPTQFDYAFASDSVVPALRQCRVVDDVAAWELSDHCPVLLDVDGW